MKPTHQYFDKQLNINVTVYPAKMPKRRCNWMRGEAFLAQKMRIGEENDRMFARFTRKNGKY